VGKDRLNGIMEDSTPPGETATPDKPIQTVYLGWPLYEKLERLADEWGVRVDSAMVRWLLARGLDAVDAGAKPETVTKIDFD